MIMARPPRPLTNEEAHALSLSARELEVLYLIAAGCSTAEVAAAMYLSGNSVKTHTQSLFRKIGVTTRLQAAVWVWSRTVDAADASGAAPGTTSEGDAAVDAA